MSVENGVHSIGIEITIVVGKSRHSTQVRGRFGAWFDCKIYFAHQKASYALTDCLLVVIDKLYIQFSTKTLLQELCAFDSF